MEFCTERLGPKLYRAFIRESSESEVGTSRDSALIALIRRLPLQPEPIVVSLISDFY